MNWNEKLPDKCPPEEAFKPDELTVYRLVTAEHICEEDFQSQRALKPMAKFNNVDECIARSLSVFNAKEKCLNLTKLPHFKGKGKTVARLDLQKDDGVILKTFKDPNHYSWWRTTNFDITNSIIETNE